MLLMIQQPPVQPPQYTNVSKAQAEQLGQNDIQWSIKNIYLRHLLKAAVDQNEAAGVITGATVVDLQTDRTLFRHNQNTEHFAASINKLPVVLLVLKDIRAGKFNLDTPTAWLASDVRAGFGTYDQPGAPLQATVGDVLFDLLNKSGNTAVRVLVNNHLGGAAKVNERWADMPNLSHTALTPLDGNRFYLGNSTPHDALWALQQLLKKQDRPGKFVRNALTTNIFTDFGVRSQLQYQDHIVLVNKIGLLDDVDGNNRHDVGVVYNKKTGKSYGYALFTTSPFDNPAATTRADQSLKDMGSYILKHAGNSRSRHHSSGWKHRTEKRVKY
jgi:beta-lactamase class A